MTFIKYPFPIHDENDHPGSNPGMKDLDALKAIAPRETQDRRSIRNFFFVILFVIVLIFFCRTFVQFPQPKATTAPTFLSK